MRRADDAFGCLDSHAGAFGIEKLVGQTVTYLPGHRLDAVFSLLRQSRDVHTPRRAGHREVGALGDDEGLVIVGLPPTQHMVHVKDGQLTAIGRRQRRAQHLEQARSLRLCGIEAKRCRGRTARVLDREFEQGHGVGPARDHEQNGDFASVRNRSHVVSSPERTASCRIGHSISIVHVTPNRQFSRTCDSTTFEARMKL